MLGLTGCSRYNAIWSNLFCSDTYYGSDSGTIYELSISHILSSIGFCNSDTPIWFRPNSPIFPSKPIMPSISFLIPKILRASISSIHKSLLMAHLESYPLRIRDKWTADLGPISTEHWNYILGLTPQLSSCEAHRVSQLFLIHRVYKSPSVLHRIGVRAGG